VKLHDLVLLQGLVRASGVFVVLSGERSGSLHFFEGQIFHAETVDLSGDAAALEILSWSEGEFISSDRAAAEMTTVSSPLAALPRRTPEPSVTHVLVSPHGELIDGHGADTRGLASRIAYVARLAELIGQSMGSGTTRCLKVRVAGSELSMHRHADGHVSGSLGPVDS
jgi:hypothetical protein